MSNSTFEISDKRIFIIVITVLSQDSRLDVSNSEYMPTTYAEVWHVAISKIRTKAVDKTLKTFINESKSVKIHEKLRKHGNGHFSRKKANFTENVMAMKSWIRLVPSSARWKCLGDLVPITDIFQYGNMASTSVSANPVSTIWGVANIWGAEAPWPHPRTAPHDLGSHNALWIPFLHLHCPLTS